METHISLQFTASKCTIVCDLCVQKPCVQEKDHATFLLLQLSVRIFPFCLFQSILRLYLWDSIHSEPYNMCSLIIGPCFLFPRSIGNIPCTTVVEKWQLWSLLTQFCHGSAMTDDVCKISRIKMGSLSWTVPRYIFYLCMEATRSWASVLAVSNQCHAACSLFEPYWIENRSRIFVNVFGSPVLK